MVISDYVCNGSCASFHKCGEHVPPESRHVSGHHGEVRVGPSCGAPPMTSVILGVMVFVLPIVALFRQDMTIVREPERDNREQQADHARHKHGAQDAQHLNIAAVQSMA